MQHQNRQRRHSFTKPYLGWDTTDDETWAGVQRGPAEKWQQRRKLGRLPMKAASGNDQYSTSRHAWTVWGHLSNAPVHVNKLKHREAWCLFMSPGKCCWNQCSTKWACDENSLHRAKQRLKTGLAWISFLRRHYLIGKSNACCRKTMATWLKRKWWSETWFLKGALVLTPGFSNVHAGSEVNETSKQGTFLCVLSDEHGRLTADCGHNSGNWWW